MARAKQLLVAIFMLFLAFIAGWFALFNKFKIYPPESSNVGKVQEVESPQSQDKVILTVSYSPEDKINYEKQLNISSSVSAFDLLKEALDANQITYETKSYDFGVFVSSINGFVSGADHTWIYFVNGQSGQVAADKYILKPQDVVEWKYITPTGE